MATTVGQHSVAAFTSPVNGTTPIDANSVRGNDNTMRSAYVDHDADTGIHVQSSTLASRPAAGTAGRKWITEDSGIYTLWFDDGVHWHPVSSEAVAITVLATENLVKGDVVKVVGWNNGQDLAEVAKTTSASDVAFAVITAAVSSGVLGYATNTGVLQDINTNAYAVGTVLYPNASGGFTSTKPTSGNYQPVAYVLRQNTNNGVIYVEFSAPRIVERSDNTASTIVLRDSNGDFSAGTITATAVNATTLDLTNLEVTNIKAKDGTQAIAIADSTGALTVSGDLTVDTDTLKVDSANNRVGVGTGTPGYPLQIRRAGGAGSLGVSVDGVGAVSRSVQYFAVGDATNVSTGHAFYVRNATATDDLAMVITNTSSVNISGDLAVDTNTLYVDATNNRVGIGTASPVVALDVAGSSARIGSGVSTSDANLGIGENRSGSGYAYIDLVGDTTYVDYGLRIIRGNTGSNATSFLSHRGTGELGIFTSEAAPITFYTTGTERMRLDASGNLGLGVTPSAWAIGKVLQISAATGSFLYGAGGQTILGTNAYYDTSWKYGGTGNASYYQQANGAHSWYTAASGTAGNAITFTQAMTLDPSGALTVGYGGTSSQDAVIDLDAGSASGGEAYMRFRRNSTTQLLLATNGSTSDVRGVANIPLTFWTNDTERARIDASGNLALGISGPFISVANRTDISVNGTTDATVSLGNGGTRRALFYASASEAQLGTKTNIPQVFITNDAERARITSGGDFLAGLTTAINGHGFKNASGVDSYRTTSTTTIGIHHFYSDVTSTQNLVAYVRADGGLANYSANNLNLASDARLKQDVVPLTSTWDKLKAIEVVNFRYKGCAESDPMLYGVIAQQIQPVAPDLVVVTREATDDDSEYYGIREQPMQWLAIKALQEAMARIESLEARLAALES